MRSQVVAGAGVVLGVIVAGFVIDQIVVGRGFPGLRFETLGDVARHVEGVVIAVAAVAVWVVAEGQRAALVGLGAAVGLLVVGLVWPLSALGAVAGVFALPLVVVLTIRVIVERRRTAVAGPR